MSIGLIVLIAIIGAFAVLIAVMVIRTLLSKRPDVEVEEFLPIKIDTERLMKTLSGAVQIPTVTVIDHKNQSYEPFLEYHKYLEKSFPLVFAHAEKHIINGYALVLILKGSDESLLPGAFLAHQDVVPAPEEGWTTPPFGGEIKDGYVYGRGARDMKGQMIANLQAMELLFERGEKLKRTIYFCFGHDEEYTGMEGAQQISQWLAGRNVKFDFLIDEGGAIVDAKLAGIKEKVALIGTCEKGYVDYVLTSAIPGGHASAPEKHGSVDRICKAVSDLNTMQMRSYWSEPLKETCKQAAPYVDKFLYRFVLVNRDILGGLIMLIAKNIHPLAAGLFRTTFAFTMLKGSNAPNVIPPEASAVVNVRINTGETRKDVEKHIRKVVGSDIKITTLQHNGGYDPSPVSSVYTEQYKALVKSITEALPEHIAVPYCFIAASDSKHYVKLCNNIYRFTPFNITTDDEHRIHALDERIDVDSMVKATKFFARFIENTCM